MKFYYAVPLVLFLAGCCAAQQPTSAKDTGKIIRLDPAFDAIVPKDAKIEKIAGGFTFTEGPVWRPEGVLWFSDVPGNLVRSITPGGLVNVIIENAGGTPVNPPRGAFVGPNGMISDKDGAVLLCQHTNRQIVRVTKELKMTPYIDKFEGHRLNSPNDLVYRSDG
ncbi:MAG: SMP-30/gluconolactonase/LRE family protein [Acidobacteriia bacterium]|nr:SMP-30/gluconolactonase/LRE family protein [Terriglobia bacterium]